MKILFIFILLLIQGCSLGPNYIPPEVDVPSNWKNPTNDGASQASCDLEYWWEVFNIPKLNDLEQQSLVNNLDLYIAYNRIEEARAMMKIAYSELYPQINLNPAYQNTGVLYESYSTRTIVRSHQLLYALPLVLNYELDVWGKIKSRYFATRDIWEAMIEAYYTVQLSLTAEVATVYFQIATLDQQLELLKSNLEALEKAFKIVQSRYNFQIIDYEDVSRAGLEVSKIQVRIQEALRLREELENLLAVLIGENPSVFTLDPIALPSNLPLILAGLPAELLLRRPDIAEAERKMAAEHQLIKVAYASFFPTINLTGGLGSESMHLRFFLRNPGRYWSFGANASQVIFDGGRLFANLAEQEARFAEAESGYQQVVLLAFKDVENALSNLEKYKNAAKEAEISVDWAKKTYSISNARYIKGLSFYLDVINSEDELINAEVALNELKGLQFVATVQLIKALGGGW